VTIFRLFFLLTIFVNVNLFAYIDTDMDGVADKDDNVTNNSDYKVQTSVSYIKSKIAVFGNYAYTFINDTSSIDNLQNIHAYSLGAGYYFKEMIYTSASYNFSNSAYKSIEDIETLSVYTSYNVSKNKSFILQVLLWLKPICEQELFFNLNQKRVLKNLYRIINSLGVEDVRYSLYRWGMSTEGMHTIKDVFALL